MSQVAANACAETPSQLKATPKKETNKLREAVENAHSHSRGTKASKKAARRHKAAQKRSDALRKETTILTDSQSVSPSTSPSSLPSSSPSSSPSKETSGSSDESENADRLHEATPGSALSIDVSVSGDNSASSDSTGTHVREGGSGSRKTSKKRFRRRRRREGNATPNTEQSRARSGSVLALPIGTDTSESPRQKPPRVTQQWLASNTSDCSRSQAPESHELRSQLVSALCSPEAMSVLQGMMASVMRRPSVVDNLLSEHDQGASHSADDTTSTGTRNLMSKFHLRRKSDHRSSSEQSHQTLQQQSQQTQQLSATGDINLRKSAHHNSASPMRWASRRASLSSSSPRSGVSSVEVSPRTPTMGQSPARTTTGKSKRSAPPDKPVALSVADLQVHFGPRIGSGGAAFIYTAMIGNHQVAAKVFNNYFLGDDAYDKEREHVKHKLDTIVALEAHENVVKLHGYTFHRGHRLVVFMPLMNGTLQELVEQRASAHHEPMCSATGSSEQEDTKLHRQSASFNSEKVDLTRAPFSCVELLGLFRQVVCGVTCLHAENIWHLDIKPENILYTLCVQSIDDFFEDDAISCNETHRNDTATVTGATVNLHKRVRLALGDFDEAVVPEPSPEITKSGSLFNSLFRASSSSSSVAASAAANAQNAEPRTANVGTLVYSAPETLGNFDDGAVYDQSADIWSLGMVLYQLMTLGVPYEHEGYDAFSLRDVVKDGVRAALPKQSYLDGPRWKNIAKLYMSCTQAEPFRRPTARAIVDRIDELLLDDRLYEERMKAFAI